jgi:hypothetical protein
VRFVIRQLRAERFEALELFDGAAVEPLGLGLIAEEEGPCRGRVASHALETLGEAESLVLVLHFEAVDLERFVERNEGRVIGEIGHGAIEGEGAEAGFEFREAEEVVLGDGDALDGEELLGVGGLIDGDEVGAEAVDGVAVLDFDDGEGGAGEGVFAGVGGGAGFAFGGAGAGGGLGVGSVGGELFS